MIELPSISPRELRARLEGNSELAILDVRREGDFAKRHLFFACNVPRSQIELKIERLLPRSDVPIVIAAKGQHANDIGEVLAQFGYNDVSLLEGELGGWTESGGKLFSGVNVPSKAFGEFIEGCAGTPHVEPKQLEEILRTDPDAVLFDCRPIGEYEAMSIPGAVNCPGVELVYRFSANVKRRTTRVYVNCAGRTRSIIAAQSLIDAGVPNAVTAVRDGAMGWRLAGFELERGANTRAYPPAPDSLAEIRRRVGARASNAGIYALSARECDAFRAEEGRTTYLFDIRDPLEFQTGHLTGAVSAPGGQLIQTFDNYVAVRNVRIILADSDGVRAPTVALWLRQMGVKELFITADGAGPSTDPPPTPRLDRLMAQSPQIAANEAHAVVVKGNAAVFDLSSSKEYRNAHVPGACFVERHQIDAAFAACSHVRTVILTSEDGRLARVVGATLKRRAGIDVFALCGGTKAWSEAGLPLEQGNGTLPAEPSDVFYRPYDRTEGTESAMRDYLDWERGLLDRIGDEPGIRFSRIDSSGAIHEQAFPV